MIGNTPIVDVSQLSPNPDVRILAKIEGQNPAGSVKDRIARNDDRRGRGRRHAHARASTIIEPSSGNTGIALAMIAQLKGYPIKIVLPENVSIERRQLLEIFGAEIILSPGDEGSNGAVRRAQQAGRRAPRLGVPLPVRQRGQPPGALRDAPAPRSGATSPTSPTSSPASAPAARSWASARTSRSRTPTSRSTPSSRRSASAVEGLRNLDDGYIPPVYEKWGGPELLDGKRIVRPRESIEWTRRLVTECGIFAGISSGAALAGAVQGRRADRRRARSCSSSATAAGSTSRPAPGPTTSTTVVERAEKIIYF